MTNGEWLSRLNDEDFNAWAEDFFKKNTCWKCPVKIHPGLFDCDKCVKDGVKGFRMMMNREVKEE